MTTFSKNPYDLLGTEETEVEQEAEPSKTAAPVEGKKVDKSRAQKGEARIKHEYPQRGGMKTVSSTRVEGEEGRAPRDRNNVGPRLQRRAEDGSEPSSRSFRGAPGGNRGPRGGFRGRGRQYDRHSATGIVDSEKKETQGWGDITTSQQESEQVFVEEVVAEYNADNADNADNAEKVEEVAEVPPVVEEEEVAKTLDEYKNELAAKTLNVTLPEVRRANEGTDDSKWKDAVILEKSDSDEVFYVGKSSEQGQRAKTSNKKEKVFVEIEQRFTERNPRGDNFDRRGGGRGRGQFGDRPQRQGSDRPRNDLRGDAPRRGRSTANGGVDVDDQNAFPVLGAR